MLLMNYQGKVIQEKNGQFSMHDQEIVTSLPVWVVILLIDVGHNLTPMCKTTDRYNYYITCYLGNISVEER